MGRTWKENWGAANKSVDGKLGEKNDVKEAKEEKFKTD